VSGAGGGARADSGGSAASGGFTYQHRVTAWFATRMLAGTTAAGVRGLYQGPVLEVTCETGEPVDDCRVLTADGILVLQAKHSINLVKAEDSEMAKTASQFVRQHLMPGHAADRLVLATTLVAPRTVTQHLSNALDRFRKHPGPPLPLDGPHAETAALATLLSHVQCEWEKHAGATPTEEQLRGFLKCCWVWVLNADHGMPAEREALDVLRTAVLSDPGQADSAWDSILRISAQATQDKTGFNRSWLGSQLVTTCGIRLAVSYEQDAAIFRAVTTWSAAQLHVHSAVPGRRPTAGEDFILPPYIPRPHDASVQSSIREVAAGQGTRLVLLRGGSCTGKTRTAYEAVRVALPGWRLAYPKTARALLDLLSGPPIPADSVIWLDDLHHLLNEPGGEDAAALLRDLLQKPGPVVLVATAWPDAYRELASTPGPEHADRHYHARALLSEALIIDVPDTFNEVDRQELEYVANGDPSLTVALQAAGPEGALCQTLAAAPELMEHWRDAPDPYGKAVITAAIDARRLGVQAPLPDAFLEAAVPDYLSQDERAQAQRGWFSKAMGYARQPVKRVTSALLAVAHPTRMGPMPGVSDLADYLEQHGASERWGQVPPASFWTAALGELTGGDDLERLALCAFSCGRFRLSRDLNLAALRKGTASAFEGLCFNYVETDRILIPHGRDELISLVRDTDDGGYSLWYLGTTLLSIHDEPLGGGQGTLIAAAELLYDSYETGYLHAAVPLADICTALGLDATGILADMKKKKTERAASSPADADRAWWRDRKSEPGIDGSIPPSALLALPARQSLSDDVIRASILRWWRESPDDTQYLLEACFRSGQFDAPMGAARTLLKLPSPAAQRLGESILDRLADDGHNPARMELAGRRIRQWQAEPAADEEVPSDILALLEKAAESRTDARRLLGQAERRRGDTSEAERHFRSALDGGNYEVLRELAEILHPHAPDDAKQLALCGLEPDGSPSPPW
jgi:hypothetical protein